MVRLIGLPTRKTNSSHAASSQGPAQRQTTSFRDRDEYRLGLGALDILLCLFTVGVAVGTGPTSEGGKHVVESWYEIEV